MVSWSCIATAYVRLWKLMTKASARLLMHAGWEVCTLSSTRSSARGSTRSPERVSARPDQAVAVGAVDRASRAQLITASDTDSRTLGNERARGRGEPYSWRIRFCFSSGTAGIRRVRKVLHT